jgi:pilus assembly protein CpaE
MPPTLPPVKSILKAISGEPAIERTGFSVYVGVKGGDTLRSLVICPDRALAGQLQSALAAMPVVIVGVVEHYPSEKELARLLRTLAPQLVFLSVEDLAPAARVAREVELNAPGVPVLSLGQTIAPEVLLEMMRAGACEFLQAPFEAEAVRAAILRVRDSAERAPTGAGLTDHVYSFLPSKAGAGTSTVALNLSLALSRLPDTRILLADFDLSSGMIGFMLKLDGRYSVTDAAENAARLDDNLWRQLVSSSGSLDVLTAGRITPGFRIETPQIRSLLDYSRRQYSAVCVDLSGNLEKYSVEIMNESERIFMVCTAEIPSLHLAREKLAFLRSIELEERVYIVLNRSTKRDIVSPAEIQRLLGLPVHCVLPNDYTRVHAAVSSGQAVDAGSALGKQFRAEAEALLAANKPPEARKGRFVEYFSLLPARYSVSPADRRSAT